MDDLDLKLIGLLRTDARESLASLAHKLKVSRGTVKNRIGRLKRDGPASVTGRMRSSIMTQKG